MADFAQAVGALASGLSLVVGTIALIRFIHQRRVRRNLGTEFSRLLRLDRRLLASATGIDLILAEGVGSRGFAIPPPKLRAHLDYLDAQVHEVERSRARIRASQTRGALDRLRQTIEIAAECIRSAFVMYRDGAWAAYRRYDGRPIQPGATGREPLAAMEGGAPVLTELREEMELAIRTAAYQLGWEDWGEAYECRWPVVRADLERLDPVKLWCGEPRPITVSAR